MISVSERYSSGIRCAMNGAAANPTENGSSSSHLRRATIAMTSFGVNTLPGSTIHLPTTGTHSIRPIRTALRFKSGGTSRPLPA